MSWTENSLESRSYLDVLLKRPRQINRLKMQYENGPLNGRVNEPFTGNEKEEQGDKCGLASRSAGIY
jgi:hypothetical protein